VSRSSLVSYVLPVVVSLGAIACSTNAPTPQNGGRGSGGIASSGGKTGSGGANTGGTAGATQTGEGGSTATGGRSGTGGSAVTGGSIATGGSTPTGGNSSGPAGGTTSAGGSTGEGGTSSATGGAGGAAAGGAYGSAGSTGTGGTGPASGGRSGADAGAGRDGAVPSTGGTNSGGSGGQAGGAGGQSNADGAPPMGGSGGSTAYNPCKSSPCKILPLGDSITHGFGSSDDAGYRSQLFKLAVAANQNITFTGSQSNGPSTVSGKTFPKNHEGHDGYTVESGYSTYGTPGISSLIPSPAFSTAPDIVLLHIGTNDLTSSNAKSTTSDRLDSLITKIVGVAPDALVVVAKLIPLGYSSSDWTNYNAKIPTIVQAHVAQGQHIVMVDMSTLPTSQLNGVHPTDQGYSYMANIWYEAIKGFLPN
jgi:lysophospholipase L1-like esterase